MKQGLLFLVAAVCLILFPVLPVQAEGAELSVSLPLTQLVTNEIPVSVSYTLTAEDPTAPMPEGSVGGVFRFTLDNEQTTSIPPIVFRESGVWNYELTAAADNATLSPEHLRIEVEIVSADGGLTPMIVAIREDGEKTDLIFTVTPEMPGQFPSAGGPGVKRYLILGVSLCGLAMIGLTLTRRRQRN